MIPTFKRVELTEDELVRLIEVEPCEIISYSELVARIPDRPPRYSPNHVFPGRK